MRLYAKPVRWGFFAGFEVWRRARLFCSISIYRFELPERMCDGALDEDMDGETEQIRCNDRRNHEGDGGLCRAMEMGIDAENRRHGEREYPHMEQVGAVGSVAEQYAQAIEPARAIQTDEGTEDDDDGSVEADKLEGWICERQRRLRPDEQTSGKNEKPCRRDRLFPAGDAA